MLRLETTLLWFQAMMNAPSGMYCGPLRLLAMEVYDTCNAAGTFCNLITGEEPLPSIQSRILLRRTYFTSNVLLSNFLYQNSLQLASIFLC